MVLWVELWVMLCGPWAALEKVMHVCRILMELDIKPMNRNELTEAHLIAFPP